MNEKVLHSIGALFDNPDKIYRAASQTAKKGYTKFDVHSPYPIHGMPEAMKLGKSKLGYAALVFGLTGLLAIFLYTYWIAAIDYPIVIGCKPFYAFPKYIPVMFEVTVLSASIGTVVTMLFFFFKLPNNSHPLHGTNYMKKVSTDGYGLNILAEDPLFNEEEVKRFMTELGAAEIEEIYFEPEEVNSKPKVLEPKFIAFLVVTFVVVSGVTYFGLNKLLYMPPFTWMAEQAKVIAQGPAIYKTSGTGMRPPVEGTVARGNIPYAYKGEPESAGENLINPLDFTKKNLDLGEKKFNTYCSPCHGYHGEGDSRLRGQFPNPPSLHSQKVREWSDGRIFHVITEGQNVMPSYATQLSREERWATILYIRALQRSLNAKESDLQ